jgi:hypothetical protein
MNSIELQDGGSRLLAIVTRKLFENEPDTRQQEVVGELIAFYEDGRDDVFFSIADQVLTQAIAKNIENYLKQLVALADGGIVNEFTFDTEIVGPIVLAAHKILSDLESMYEADLTEIGRILRNPAYRGSVAKLVREKIDRYLQLFAARNVDIADVYGNTTQHSTGEAYEEYVGSIFEKAGWETVRTPASGDQGADLVCMKAGSKLVVQCKFYAGNVGNAAVQEVHAARGFYEASHAVVVSNAGYTRSAIALAEKLGILLVSDDKLEQFVRG